MSGPGEAHVFEFSGGELCLDFANTIDNRSDPEREDHLRTYADLLAWAEQSGALRRAEVNALARRVTRRPQGAGRVLTRALQLREAIYAAFSARAAGRCVPSEAIDIIAREAALAAGHRRIVRVDNDRFAQTWEPSAEHLDRPLWPIAQSAAEVLTSGRLDQVRECALETCGWLFLDASRNRSRRWCDMKICGNRAKARRFYERTRAAE